MKILNQDEELVVNQVIEIHNLKKAVLEEVTLNIELLNEIDSNIIFQNGKYHEFGDLRNVFSETVIRDVFNEHEVKNLQKQLKQHFNWPVSKNTGKTNLSYSLSKPIFTEKRNYSLVMYSYGNKVYEIGGSGVMLFEKTKRGWALVGEFWGTMS